MPIDDDNLQNYETQDAKAVLRRIGLRSQASGMHVGFFPGGDPEFPFNRPLEALVLDGGDSPTRRERDTASPLVVASSRREKGKGRQVEPEEGAASSSKKYNVISDDDFESGESDDEGDLEE